MQCTALRRDAERYCSKEDHTALKKQVREKDSPMSINATNRRLSERRNGTENDESDSTAPAWHYSSSVPFEMFIDFIFCLLFLLDFIVQHRHALRPRTHLRFWSSLFVCARGCAPVCIGEHAIACLSRLSNFLISLWYCMIVSIVRPVGRKLWAGTRNTQSARGEDGRKL